LKAEKRTFFEDRTFTVVWPSTNVILHRLSVSRRDMRLYFRFASIFQQRRKSDGRSTLNPRCLVRGVWSVLIPVGGSSCAVIPKNRIIAKLGELSDEAYLFFRRFLAESPCTSILVNKILSVGASLTCQQIS
jgi:hypothetical protein